ncbi:hypothetical protein [Mucilaginibacter sp.]|uniref:hypothetical protein n=1 Tax=Mucilaginibacter sp. TaxID=1882438 RepID=UPI002842542B|nr:hypothetical protein [Mucilaginibacter sp.]MDR3694661.1 hypothetical protein [Mucilaginibacter sp.]
MKTKLLLIVVVGLQLCLLSCTKTNINHLLVCCGANPPAASIFNKWNIVSDSTYAGVGITNHPVDYAGQAGDYFDIRTNNIIYTKEGNVLDTLTYNALTDSTIVISSFGITLNGVLSPSHFKVTAHSLYIASPEIATPGGVFGRRITLSR